MSELFTYGSVGGAGYNLGAMAPGEGPLLPGRNRVTVKQRFDGKGAEGCSSWRRPSSF
jgi:hypothetical protein